MSFLDRLSKAVSETVDRGKRELDQMQRINRVKGEIRDVEKKIADLEALITSTKVQVGEKAMEMLRAGTLVNPELQPFVDTVAQSEQQIAEARNVIAEKEQAIEAIKAEEKQPAPPAPAEAPAQGAAPAPAAGGQFCAQCGAAVSPGAAFCPQCGAKQS